MLYDRMVEDMAGESHFDPLTTKWPFYLYFIKESLKINFSTPI